MTTAAGHEPFVVVGVDGSPNSVTALQWAARYAESAGAELHAVIAWENVLGFGFAPVGAADLQREARRVLHHTVNKALGKDCRVRVVAKVERGNASAVLVEAAKRAELLIVGSRGHGGFANLLLGSVGENCVRQAHCSVVVVRAGR